MRTLDARAPARRTRVPGMDTLVLAVFGTFTASAQGQSTLAVSSTATISLEITEDLVERNDNITGIAQVSGGLGGAFELHVELEDQYGRVVDRVELKSTATNNAGAFEVPFSLDTTWFLTMLGTVHGSGRFSSSGSDSPSAPVHAKPVNISIIPYPLDYDDYWANVWGGGSTNSNEYFAALQKASVGLGHLYRDYDCTYAVLTWSTVSLDLTQSLRRPSCMQTTESPWTTAQATEAITARSTT